MNERKRKSKCYICGKPIPEKEKTCPSCSAFLDSYHLSFLLSLFPFHLYPEIDRQDISEIVKIPEIVAQIKEISHMSIEDLQDNSSFINIKVAELTDQIEDKKLRNTASRFFQLIMDLIVSKAYKGEQQRAEDIYEREFLRAKSLIDKTKILMKLNENEITQEDIDLIFSIDKPYDIIKGNISKIKTPALKSLVLHNRYLQLYIYRYKWILQELKRQQGILLGKIRFYARREEIKGFLNNTQEIYQSILKKLKEDPIKNQKRIGDIEERMEIYETQRIKSIERRKEFLKRFPPRKPDPYSTKIKDYSLEELKKENVSVAIQIRGYSKILKNLKKALEEVNPLLTRIIIKAKDTEKKQLFDMLDKMKKK